MTPQAGGDAGEDAPGEPNPDALEDEPDPEKLLVEPQAELEEPEVSTPSPSFAAQSVTGKSDISLRTHIQILDRNLAPLTKKCLVSRAKTGL